MYYCITYGDYFFHNKGRIVLFSTVEDASLFKKLFFEWAQQKGLATYGIGFMPDFLVARANTQIEEWTYKDYEGMKIITYEDLKNECGVH